MASSKLNFPEFIHIWFFFFLLIFPILSPQVFLGTIPSRPACATGRSSCSPSTPWPPPPCIHQETAPTTTTSRSPTRTSSRAWCEPRRDTLHTAWTVWECVCVGVCVGACVCVWVTRTGAMQTAAREQRIKTTTKITTERLLCWGERAPCFL